MIASIFFMKSGNPNLFGVHYDGLASPTILADQGSKNRARSHRTFGAKPKGSKPCGKGRKPVFFDKVYAPGVKSRCGVACRAA
jgi:hypothetical protein